ncbi:MAG: hypothetical protein ACXVA3_16070, partial [Vulcanimicrobiaceae bacterium]
VQRLKPTSSLGIDATHLLGTPVSSVVERQHNAPSSTAAQRLHLRSVLNVCDRIGGLIPKVREVRRPLLLRREPSGFVYTSDFLPISGSLLALFVPSAQVSIYGPLRWLPDTAHRSNRIKNACNECSLKTS